jgi:hypothetical protein
MVTGKNVPSFSPQRLSHERIWSNVSGVIAYHPSVSIVGVPASCGVAATMQRDHLEGTVARVYQRVAHRIGAVRAALNDQYVLQRCTRSCPCHLESRADTAPKNSALPNRLQLSKRLIDIAGILCNVANCTRTLVDQPSQRAACVSRVYREQP